MRIEEDESNVRIKIDCVIFLSTNTKETTPRHCRPLFPDLTTLQISHQNLLQLSHSLIMELNKLRQPADAAADMHARCRIRDLHCFKNTPDALITLIFLWRFLYHQSTSIE